MLNRIAAAWCLSKKGPSERRIGPVVALYGRALQSASCLSEVPADRFRHFAVSVRDYPLPHSAAPNQPDQDVTKAEIIERVSSGTGLTRIETEVVVNGFIAVVVAALKRGDSVKIRGFGSFRPQHRPARTARNPVTKAEVKVAARYVLVFKPSKELRSAVNRSLSSE